MRQRIIDIYCLIQYGMAHLRPLSAHNCAPKTKLVLSMLQRSSGNRPDWKVCLARPISLPRILNFSRGSSREIFVKQQKETIELLFIDTNTAAQAISTLERSPAHSANFPIWEIGTQIHPGQIGIGCNSRYVLYILILK